MTKLSLIIAGFIFMPLVSTADVACPLGAKEDHLTINRVMRNFGRFIMYADGVCVKAQNPWEKDHITDQEITEAIGKMDLVVACAEAVLKDPTGDVLPGKLLLMKDEKEKAELVDDYVYFMTDFKDAVIEYRELFKKLLTQKAADRNYDEVNTKRQEVDALVERAHKKL
ncbi:MAG: hypothetical protein JSU04_18260 [Bdellovibrionales bacterium]|nr:hypothetical protein [Bdellovibrionales bacterium]